VAPDAHYGLGQRVLATDTEDVPLMEIRSIEITDAANRG
jgi:protein involved in temperature-dependent protein secretion